MSDVSLVTDYVPSADSLKEHKCRRSDGPILFS